jgi:hypothetical protein
VLNSLVPLLKQFDSKNFVRINSQLLNRINHVRNQRHSQVNKQPTKLIRTEEEDGPTPAKRKCKLPDEERKIVASSGKKSLASPHIPSGNTPSSSTSSGNGKKSMASPRIPSGNTPSSSTQIDMGLKSVVVTRKAEAAMSCN